MNETTSNTITKNEQITATMTMTNHQTNIFSMTEGTGLIAGIVIWCVFVLSCSFLLIKIAKSQWRIKNGTLYNAFQDSPNVFLVNEYDPENADQSSNNVIVLTEIDNNNKNQDEKIIKS